MAGRKQALFTRYESIQYLHRYLQLSSSCQISASLLQNIYGIYTSMVSTHLWYLHIYGIYNFSAEYLRVHYKISMNLYGIYTSMVSTTLLPDIFKFTTKYPQNPYGIYRSMVSTNFLQDIYELLRHLQPSMVTMTSTTFSRVC